MSKTTGQPELYRWLVEPDLDALADGGDDSGDDSGEHLASMVAGALAKKMASTAASGAADVTASPWDDVAGTLTATTRHDAVLKLAAALRGRGGWRPADAQAYMRVVVWPQIDQGRGEPPHPYTVEEFEGDIRDAFARYKDGAAEREDEGDGGRAERQAALLAREVAEQRVRREARRILDAEARPPVRRPEILTLRERLARPRTSVAYRIEGWQPIGTRVVLAAQFKAGKTTATGNAARSLVDGDPWLGQYKVVPIVGTLVILDFEMSEDQLEGWLADQCIVNDDRVIPISMRGNAAAFDILDRARRAEWADELRRLGCEYLILDCLRPVLDSLGLDEHREAGRFLVAFDELMSDASVEDGLVVHHMGHSGERSRGDSRIRDWPDAEWRLVREDPDDPASPRYLSAYGRDVDVAESQLSFDSATRHLSVVGGSRRDAAAIAALVDVLASLDGEQRLSARRIEDRVLAVTDHPRLAIREALKLGIRDKIIHVEDGPRRARLHSQCASAPHCAASAPARSFECASAPIGRRTQTTSSGQSSAPAREVPCIACGHIPPDHASDCSLRPVLLVACPNCNRAPTDHAKDCTWRPVVLCSAGCGTQLPPERDTGVCAWCQQQADAVEASS